MVTLMNAMRNRLSKTIVGIKGGLRFNVLEEQLQCASLEGDEPPFLARAFELKTMIYKEISACHQSFWK